MGTALDRSLRLDCSQAGEFHLFSDGFLLQSLENPGVFVFYWVPSPLGVRSLRGNSAQVDIGPKVNNPTLEAVSPDYIVIVWDDLP